jgi:hypothetical protein
VATAALTRCRSCNASVFFAPSTLTGKRLILDAEPDPDRGNVIVGAGHSWATVLTALELDAARERDEELYLDHHATCPQASTWRGARL